jgi:PAS domain S-box-containing protein
MKDEDSEKTRQQLLEEVVQLRQRVAALEGVDLERRRAEEALRQSEGRYRALAESTRDIICILDRQGTLLYANQAAWQYTGIPSEEIPGKRQTDLFPPEMAQAHLEKISRVFVTGEAMEEDELFHFGPQEVWLRIHLLPLRDEAGQTTSVMGVAHNITDRKRAEEALRKAHDELDQRVEERTAELTRANEELAIFREFAESSGDGFGMSDFDGRILYANPSLCRLFGEEGPEDVVGKNVSAYYLREYVQRRKDEMIPTLLREGYWHAEQTVSPRHGKLIQTLQSTFLIRDESGNPFRIAVVISDITKRKQAEEALRRSHGEFRAIYDGMADGLLIADVTTTQFLRANPSICRMLGYSEPELLSMSIRDIHPAEAMPATLEVFQALSEGRIQVNQNSPVLRKDGSVFYADIASNALSYAGRSCALGIFRDVTERRRASEALLRERRTLKHMLKASDHERRLIAYDIHDGLAQELAAAIMQFETFNHLKEVKPKQAADAYHAAMTMLRQGHFEVRRLISGVRPPILDQSGVMAAIAHLIHEPPFDQGPMIDFRSRVSFNRLDPILENVVYRIVQEGLTNARNHSNSSKILVSLVQRGGRLRIEIRDWGVGFDPKAVRENCFGLKGIRQRARILRGKCSIKSKAGEGTAVIVELPVVEQEVNE